MTNNSVAVDGWVAYNGIDLPEDELGNVWVLQNLEGWYGGVDIRSGAVARPTADGDFDGTSTRAGRKVEVSGTLIARDPAMLRRGMDRIARVLSGSARRGPLIVDEKDISLTRTSDVRLDGPTMVKQVSRRTAEFSLSLYSPDPSRYSLDVGQVSLTPGVSGAGHAYNLAFPRKYGALGSTGRGLLENAGDARTYPVATFTGPVNTPSISDEFGTLTLNMTLLAGEKVIVDCAQRTVLYGGASRRHLLSSNSSWLVLDSGPNVLVFTSSSGNGTALIEWQSAWS